MEKEEWLANSLQQMIRDMQEIQFICKRAKTFQVEEKDIEEILKITKKSI